MPKCTPVIILEVENCSRRSLQPQFNGAGIKFALMDILTDILTDIVTDNGTQAGRYKGDSIDTAMFTSFSAHRPLSPHFGAGNRNAGGLVQLRYSELTLLTSLALRFKGSVKPISVAEHLKDTSVPLPFSQDQDLMNHPPVLSDPRCSICGKSPFPDFSSFSILSKVGNGIPDFWDSSFL